MTERVNPLKDTIDFAIEQLKTSTDRMDYVIHLQALYFAEYCEAPSPVRDLLDGLFMAGKAKATEIAIRDKVDEKYGIGKK